MAALDHAARRGAANRRRRALEERVSVLAEPTPTPPPVAVAVEPAPRLSPPSRSLLGHGPPNLRRGQTAPPLEHADEATTPASPARSRWAFALAALTLFAVPAVGIATARHKASAADTLGVVQAAANAAL